jgi:hypothetical protein
MEHGGKIEDSCYMVYLTAIWLTPGGSGTVHIYTQYTEYRDGTYITLKKLNINNDQKNN